MRRRLAAGLLVATLPLTACGNGIDGRDAASVLPAGPEIATSAEADFERRWGELMAEHQEGAIAMLRAVLARGEDDATRALATELLEARREELAGLRDLPGA